MKTTIKLSTTKSLTVEPCRHSDLVCLNMAENIAIQGMNQHIVRDVVYLTPDQVGALIFGLEQATPETVAARIKREFDAECM